MGIDLPPSLVGNAAAAIVRKAEGDNKNLGAGQAQSQRNNKNAGDDARNAAMKRKSESGQR